MNKVEAIPYDTLLADIAGYVDGYEVASDDAFDTARLVLIDSLACALDALAYQACTRLLGPVVPGATLMHGARVPGTAHALDPVSAAFSIGAMVRWTDFNDTFVAAQTTHPSDDVGAILATADYLSRVRRAQGKPPLRLKTVLEAMIKAHEIQGVLGMRLNLNPHGIDHVLLVKVACGPVVAKLLGGDSAQIMAAASLAFFDAPLCVHRLGSNTGPRKGWAAAEAASHAVRLALMAVNGEPGYPQVLTHPKWGFNKTRLGGAEMKRGAEFGTQVMEKVLFKLGGPAVIHAQSAVECALQMSPSVRARLDEIAEIRIATHRRTMETIDKSGPLRNPADRDHCLQYAVAVALMKGALTSDDYEDEAAADPRIERLRALMRVREEPQYTARALDPALRANPCAMEVQFGDGTRCGPVKLDYPAGHPARRRDGVAMLIDKFRKSLARRFSAQQQETLLALCLDHSRLVQTTVDEFTDLLVRG